MNQKTDIPLEEDPSQEDEFTRGYLTSLIVLMMVVFASVFAFEKGEEWLHYNVIRPYIDKPPLSILLPETYASFETIYDGIVFTFSDEGRKQIEAAGNGKIVGLSRNAIRELTLPSLALKIGMLISIIAACIIVPTLFFFNWRARRIDKESFYPNSPLRISGIWYALSIVLIVSIVVTALSSAVSSYRLHQIRSQRSILSAECEKLGVGIKLIELEVYQYRLLPRELGGGNGTYLGFVLTPELAKNQNGIFTISTNQNHATITAHSPSYPGSIITNTLNEQGQSESYKVKGALDYKEWPHE